MKASLWRGPEKATNRISEIWCYTKKSLRHGRVGNSCGKLPIGEKKTAANRPLPQRDSSTERRCQQFRAGAIQGTRIPSLDPGPETTSTYILSCIMKPKNGSRKFLQICSEVPWFALFLTLLRTRRQASESLLHSLETKEVQDSFAPI